MLRLYSLLLLILLSVPALAQSPKKLLKMGDKELKDGYVNQAISYYQQADSIVPGNILINLRLGAAYLESDLKHRALPYLEKAYALDPYVDVNIEYMMGLAHQYNYHFGDARKHYTKYQGINRQAEPYIKQRLQECQVGDSLIMSPQPVDIINLGSVVNSSAHDYTPVISADETVLVFTSRRKGSTGGEVTKDNQYFEDIYIASKNGDDWSKPKGISKNVNHEFHDAATALSPDGKQLFLYKESNGGDLYLSSAKGNDWTEAEPLPSPINSEHWETSGSITADGKRFYFASNRPGGLGGLDLYYCDKLADGKWGEAVNVGAPINTPHDEDSPFIHADGETLYFSSNGHKGLGEFDIFYSELKGKSWQQPINMGYPINTPDNDVSFVISGDKYHAYFSSIREFGEGRADIYSVTFLNHPKHKAWLAEKQKQRATQPIVKKPEPETPERKSLVTIKGSAYNSQTKAQVLAHIIVTNTVTNQLVADIRLDETDGTFEIPVFEAGSYAIHAESGGFNFYSRNIKIADKKGATIDYDVWLQPLSVGAKVVLANIFFDTNAASLRTESLGELQKIYEYMTQTPTVSLQVNGHTDDTGAASYNKVLSRRRAQAVVDYLVRNGIEAKRLKAVGFGEDDPLVSNDDEFDGRAINRRTEIEILSF